MSLYNSTFYELAQRSEKRAEAATDGMTAQENYFLAANYYRQADFYLHANWTDPLINWYWAKQTASFNKAIASLPVPGERITISADGFSAIGIFYKPETPPSNAQQSSSEMGMMQDRKTRCIRLGSHLWREAGM